MITISEEHVGWDNQALAFPNVSTCLSITVNVSQGPLIGAHFTIGTTSEEFDAAFGKMKGLTGNKPVAQILVAGVIAE